MTKQKGWPFGHQWKFVPKQLTMRQTLEQQLYDTQVNHLKIMSEVEDAQVKLGTEQARLAASNDRIKRLKEGIANEPAIQPLAPHPSARG